MSIDTNNVTFSCAGHILDGTGSGSGIYINHRVGVSVENCSIEGFNFGINMTNSVFESFWLYMPYLLSLAFILLKTRLEELDTYMP